MLRNTLHLPAPFQNDSTKIISHKYHFPGPLFKKNTNWKSFSGRNSIIRVYLPPSYQRAILTIFLGASRRIRRLHLALLVVAMGVVIEPVKVFAGASINHQPLLLVQIKLIRILPIAVVDLAAASFPHFLFY